MPIAIARLRLSNIGGYLLLVKGRLWAEGLGAGGEPPPPGVPAACGEGEQVACAKVGRQNRSVGRLKGCFWERTLPEAWQDVL